VLRSLALAVAVTVPAATAAASPADHCHAVLDQHRVPWRAAARPGIAIAVEIDGPMGGVRWTPSGKGPLVIDCSLAVSLAEAGPYLVALGIEHATWSSAYSRRNVRGTSRPSKHSFGLAVDVPRFGGPDLETLTVALDYEQGLGDEVDCLGQPVTQGGAVLKVLQCQLVRSGLFHLVLSPDYDDAHHDHFHLEALPWTERATVRSTRPAIH